MAKEFIHGTGAGADSPAAAGAGALETAKQYLDQLAFHLRSPRFDETGYVNGAPGNGNGSGANGGPLDLKTQVEAVERRAIQRALEASGGNRRQAASLLGISLRTLFYKMRRLPVN